MGVCCDSRDLMPGTLRRGADWALGTKGPPGPACQSRLTFAALAQQSSTGVRRLHLHTMVADLARDVGGGKDDEPFAPRPSFEAITNTSPRMIRHRSRVT